ncbi:TetR/AcrR family transcriptional regulator, partial [Bacillus sp. JJ1532]|uniref:TetR/AcrR family transcriptional regulator n=2 Tax=unclassified Bacillus (in: firmicutes) TaxID=185979 RepID=UPI002FFEBE29
MPKQTFFHLPKDKQDTLIRAAKKEFSRVPLHEASIANIIKEAEIPRGSFYQYFEGKEDLYYYLLNQISEKNNDRFIALLKEKNGNIFETLIDSFQFM